MASSVIRADWFKTKTGWAGSSAPSLNALRVVGASLVLVYDENLTPNAPTASQFTVLVNGAGNVVTGVAAAKSGRVTLTLTTPVTTGQTVTVAYTAAGAVKITDANGVLAAAFAAQAVVNNT